MLLNWDRPVLDVIAAFLLPGPVALLEFNERRMKSPTWNCIFFRHDAVCPCGGLVKDHFQYADDSLAKSIKSLEDLDDGERIKMKKMVAITERIFLEAYAEIPDDLEKRWMNAFGEGAKVISPEESFTYWVIKRYSSKDCETFLQNELKLESFNFGEHQIVFECRNETFTGILMHLDDPSKPREWLEDVEMDECPLL